MTYVICYTVEAGLFILGLDIVFGVLEDIKRDCLSKTTDKF